MRHKIVQALIEAGAIAVVRMEDPEKLHQSIKAIRKGGMNAIEITMTTPNALRAIEKTVTTFADDEDVIVGAGSVLDGVTARQAIHAGAKFVVSPVLDSEMIEACHRYDIPAIPGTFTPTEVQRAHKLGADLVKVFPASTVGPDFFRALKGPLPHVKLMPTGGVSLTNAGQWLDAGASVVGVGSALLDDDAIANENFGQLTENARTLRRTIDEARD